MLQQPCKKYDVCKYICCNKIWNSPLLIHPRNYHCDPLTTTFNNIRTDEFLSNQVNEQKRRSLNILNNPLKIRYPQDSKISNSKLVNSNQLETVFTFNLENYSITQVLLRSVCFSSLDFAGHPFPSWMKFVIVYYSNSQWLLWSQIPFPQS